MRATKHPSEATLALHAGGDLGPIARWRTERHLRQCESCQDEILAYQEVRRMVVDLSAMPEVPWARLSAEMQANIRLGLAAGECVRETDPHESGWMRFTAFRTAVAAASVAILIGASLLIERPARRIAEPRDNQVVLKAARDGVQLSAGNELVDLKHDSNGASLGYLANAQGSMQNTSVDPLTGDVTVTGVSW